VLAAVAAGRWSGLSSRFEVPVDESEGSAAVREPEPTPPASGRGTRRTTWDELSEGRDPTVEAADPPTPSSAVDQPSDPSADQPGPSPTSP